MTVSVFAKITAQPGKRDEVEAVFGALLRHVESEPGTLVYVRHKDSGQAPLDAHGTSDAMKSVGGSLRGLLAGRPELHFATPVGGKGS